MNHILFNDAEMKDYDLIEELAGSKKLLENITKKRSTRLRIHMVRTMKK